MDTLQNDPRIRTLYSQAAGLTHFLIYYDDGRYRDALVIVSLDGLLGPRRPRHAWPSSPARTTPSSTSSIASFSNPAPSSTKASRSLLPEGT